MVALCPAQGPDDPLVRSLLGIVDCNVQGLVRGGYATLFEPSSGFSTILTSLLTIYVAVLGYRLLLGRTQLRIGELALTAVKIGAILALTTGWATYQTVVYNFLFRGPAELADAMLAGVQPQGSLFRGDVFDGLQAVFDALNAFAAAYTQHTAGQPSLPGAAPAGAPGGFGAQGLTVSAMTLLLSTLGVLLATKIVLGLLLAVGPIFIALMLFQSTRGLFEGWLRASLAFALAPLAITVILGLDLTVLEPFLLRMRDQLAQNDYSTAPVYGLLILVLVFAAVSALTLVAGGVIALGLRLPRFRDAPGAIVAGAGGQNILAAQAAPSRAERVAAATAALQRREIGIFAQAATGEDRRAAITVTQRGARAERGPAGAAPEARLGQGPRRGATPKGRRADARSAR